MGDGGELEEMLEGPVKLPSGCAGHKPTTMMFLDTASRRSRRRAPPSCI
jgi:hypothetical protein